MDTRRQKRYESLSAKGSNLTFVCRGLVVAGPNPRHLLLSATLIFLSWAGAVFMLLPFLQIDSLWVSLVAPVSLGLLNELLLFATALRDPGFLPPATDKVSDEENKENCALYRAQYCSICRIVKPPRARHCRICGQCCLQVDHHCPWTGICVGERNYAPFFLFVVSCALSAFFNIAASVVVILGWIQKLETDQYTLRAVGSIGGLLWFSFVFALLVSLLSFHCYLMYKRQTTVEYLREAHNSLSSRSTRGGIVLPVSQMVITRNLDMDQSENSSCVYGCCPPATRLLPMWQEHNDGDDDEEEARRERLLRQIEESLVQALANEGIELTSPQTA